MSDSLKGLRVQATIQSRIFTPEELSQLGRNARQASKDMFELVREKAHNQMRDYIEWVADQYVAAGGNKDDLLLNIRLAENTDVSYSYIFLVDKRRARQVGEARLEWVHDGLRVITESIYGQKPQEGVHAHS